MFEHMHIAHCTHSDILPHSRQLAEFSFGDVCSGVRERVHLLVFRVVFAASDAVSRYLTIAFSSGIVQYFFSISVQMVFLGYLRRGVEKMH